MAVNPNYLASVFAGMQAPAQGQLTSAPVGQIPANDPFGIKGMAGPPAPIAVPAQLPPDVAPPAPPEAAGPPAPPAGPSAAPTPAEPDQTIRRPFPLVPVEGGGVIPAHEVDLRGPTLRAQQQVANDALGTVSAANTERTQDAAAHEYGMYLDQERQAALRQRAAEQAAAERDEELAQRGHDFDQSVKALSKMAFQPDGGFWASRTTPQKIGAMVQLSLGGFLQGARGGSNPGLDVINQQIEREVKAQEFAFHAGLSTAQAKQTAFGLAMQKYNSVDAARAMARASALDAVQAQVAQNAAIWKGTQAANHGDAMMVALEEQKMNQIAQGVRFIQPQVAGGGFRDPATGIAYTNKEAQKLAEDWRSQGHDLTKIDRTTYGNLLHEEAKGAHQAQKDVRAELVQLPNGDTIRAPSAAEATTLRGLATAVSNAQQLVNEARQIRQGTAWRVPGTSERGRLESIQSELTLAFKDRGGLGALSGPDMNLALGATGDVTSQGPNVDARLGQFMGATNRALQNRVKTLPDAPDSAKGVMPKDFTPHGKK